MAAAPTIWDISQPLRAALPLWPGDTAFAAEPRWTYGPGSPVNVAAFTASTHSGAHADAPLHYDPAGAAIDAVDLNPYLGRCLLIDARTAGPLIGPDFVEATVPEGTERVLMRTYERFPHEAWVEAFTAVHPKAIERLATRGVRLIGLDSPSLDPQASKTMDAHQAVRRADMRVLEGLVPLKGLDASPVRAILRALP
jgi:arylformamidase